MTNYITTSSNTINGRMFSTAKSTKSGRLVFFVDGKRVSSATYGGVLEVAAGTMISPRRAV